MKQEDNSSVGYSSQKINSDNIEKWFNQKDILIHISLIIFFDIIIYNFFNYKRQIFCVHELS